jgi:LmbE family N-acetylglucosaminyl deacetylase
MNQKDQNNCYALIISPHPDDADLGIGGTVALWIREGKQVVYIVCTSGEKGTDDPHMDCHTLARLREQEQLMAARTLGVKDVVFLHHKDQMLEETQKFRKQIVTIIRTYRPLIVATTDPDNPVIWHRDHRITGQLVLDAVYPYARKRLAYPDLIKKGLEPHKVEEILLWNTGKPDHFHDITSTYDLKIAALKCHNSQFGHLGTGWVNALRKRHHELALEQESKLVEAFRRIQIYW